jgi:hypothetical protein
MTDSLFACRHVKQNSPTAMCRPTLNFFLSLPMPSIPSFFTSCLFEDFLSVYCAVCFFPFDMLNEYEKKNEIITSHFLLMIDGGFERLNLILFHTETKCKHNRMAYVKLVIVNELSV